MMVTDDEMVGQTMMMESIYQPYSTLYHFIPGHVPGCSRIWRTPRWCVLPEGLL